MDKRESLKVIQEAYFKIQSVLESGRYEKEYYNLIRGEEKDHRRFCPDNVSCGLTIGEAVKIFYVQTIFDYLFNGRKLSTKDFLHVRKSHFFACSLVENYKEELNKALQGVDVERVNLVDYARLM